MFTQSVGAPGRRSRLVRAQAVPAGHAARQRGPAALRGAGLARQRAQRAVRVGRPRRRPPGRHRLGRTAPAARNYTLPYPIRLSTQSDSCMQRAGSRVRGALGPPRARAQAASCRRRTMRATGWRSSRSTTARCARPRIAAPRCRAQLPAAHARLRPRACGARCAARAPAQVAGRLLAEALARNPAAVAAVGSPDVHRAFQQVSPSACSHSFKCQQSAWMQTVVLAMTVRAGMAWRAAKPLRKSQGPLESWTGGARRHTRHAGTQQLGRQRRPLRCTSGAACAAGGEARARGAGPARRAGGGDAHQGAAGDDVRRPVRLDRRVHRGHGGAALFRPEGARGLSGRAGRARTAEACWTARHFVCGARGGLRAHVGPLWLGWRACMAGLQRSALQVMRRVPPPPILPPLSCRDIACEACHPSRRHMQQRHVILITGRAVHPSRSCFPGSGGSPAPAGRRAR